MAKAAQIYRDKAVPPDGSIVEMTIWQLPSPEPGRPQSLKYSLYYGRAGERIVGYDNETGKGDHRHYRDREEPYAFADIDTLVADFLAGLRREGVNL